MSFLSFVVVPLDFSHLFSFPFAQGRSCYFRGVVYLHIKRFFMNSVCQHCSSRSFLRELFCSRFFLYVVLVSSSTRPVGQKPNDHTTLKKYKLKKKNFWLFFSACCFQCLPEKLTIYKKSRTVKPSVLLALSCDSFFALIGVFYNYDISVLIGRMFTSLQAECRSQ